MTMKQRLKIIGAVSYTHADPSRKILKHFSGQNSTNLSQVVMIQDLGDFRRSLLGQTMSPFKEIN